MVCHSRLIFFFVSSYLFFLSLSVSVFVSLSLFLSFSLSLVSIPIIFPSLLDKKSIISVMGNSCHHFALTRLLKEKPFFSLSTVFYLTMVYYTLLKIKFSTMIMGNGHEIFKVTFSSQNYPSGSLFFVIFNIILIKIHRKVENAVFAVSLLPQRCAPRLIISHWK